MIGREKILKNIEPIDPEYVLLGLILESFLPLKIFPKTYPPISDRNVVDKIHNRITRE